MNNAQTRELCLSLMRAETEVAVIDLLKEAGFWENRNVWRYYGDRENNFSTIGNQQSRADAALVEKLINSVDARLMNECLIRGIDPEGSSAPQTIREAVAWFFDKEDASRKPLAGLVKNWPTAMRTQVARKITLVSTGASARDGNPCFTISDQGEGQTPDAMPSTLLSIDKSNKLRIPFVQGKFNMGGTGALKFCGKHNLELIVSRRNPNILPRILVDQSDTQWGFTVVRREDPEGGRRNSVYTYLAPNNADSSQLKGTVLRFTSETMPIFPIDRNPYAEKTEWGTLVKLYEYETTGYKTNILLKDGILGRLDLLLADVALPIRLYECRAGYHGHQGSFQTTLTGLGVRLDDDKKENLEDGFPASVPMNAGGEQMISTIYAFKKGKADAYRKNEGIIFTINGQTHGHLTIDFYRRKQVGLSYLADSILVIVDCSKLSGRAREDLFMNSRDRLSSGELRLEIEHLLEDILKHHEGLRELRERRRREEVEARMEDSKPLEDVLKSLIEKYPSLSTLFQFGKYASNPFKTVKARESETPFEGKRYPTYFRFKEQPYGTILNRNCHLNVRCRVVFETDAVNDYFHRDIDQGEFKLELVSDDFNTPVMNCSMPPYNGIATLSFQLPISSKVGDSLKFVVTVTDPSRLEPFTNIFTVNVMGEITEKHEGGGGTRKTGKDGKGEDRSFTAGIQLPKPTKVYESDWAKYNFNEFTALQAKYTGDTTNDSDGSSNGTGTYDFFINMDNVHLKRYLKTDLKKDQDEGVAKTRFEVGLILVSLALIYQGTQAKNTNSDQENDTGAEVNVEDRIAEVTSGLAPFLLPMIDSLGSLEADDLPATDVSGEAV